MTYNPETDFYGGINPNTSQWVDLLYAGFKANDLIRKVWADSAYTTHNQNGQAVNITAGTPMIQSDYIRISGTSTGQNGYTSPCYYMLITEPIYINESVKIDLAGMAKNNTGNFCGGFFITNTKNLGNVTMDSSMHINDNRIKTLLYNGSSGSATWRYDGENLKSLVENKFSDFTVPYYIGFYVSSSWQGSSGYVEFSKLSIGG